MSGSRLSNYYLRLRWPSPLVKLVINLFISELTELQWIQILPTFSPVTPEEKAWRKWSKPVLIKNIPSNCRCLSKNHLKSPSEQVLQNLIRYKDMQPMFEEMKKMLTESNLLPTVKVNLVHSPWRNIYTALEMCQFNFSYSSTLAYSHYGIFCQKKNEKVPFWGIFKNG